MATGVKFLPIDFLMLASSKNTRDVAIKTIPSATKPEIKKFLESAYGFEVEKVRTLNMQGKKTKKAGRMVATPEYKKAYVTLKNESSFSQDIFRSNMQNEKRKESKFSLIGKSPTLKRL